MGLTPCYVNSISLPWNATNALPYDAFSRLQCVEYSSAAPKVCEELQYACMSRCKVVQLCTGICEDWQDHGRVVNSCVIHSQRLKTQGDVALHNFVDEVVGSDAG